MLGIVELGGEMWPGLCECGNGKGKGRRGELVWGVGVGWMSSLPSLTQSRNARKQALREPIVTFHDFE
jgi:hypothetical protein